MKGISVVLCAGVLSAASMVGAQESSLQVGLQGGAAIASLVGSDAEGSSARTSPFLGASLVFHKPKAIAGFETGILYVPKGATTSFEGAKYALEINYIEIPLLARFGLPLEGSKIMPVLSVGASIGIKAGCNLSGESGSASVEIGCDDSIFGGQFDLKALDLGVTAGGGVDIPIGQRLLLAPSVRYTRGISVIGDTSDNADATNSAFQLGVGFRIRM